MNRKLHRRIYPPLKFSSRENTKRVLLEIIFARKISGDHNGMIVMHANNNNTHHSKVNNRTKPGCVNTKVDRNEE